MVELGITHLTTDWHLRRYIEFKSIGLITNHTGVNENLLPNYQVIAELLSCRLAAIFTPEHGLGGAAQDGVAQNETYILDIRRGISDEKRPDGIDTVSVPVYSLYGDNLRPTPEQLEGIDVLIYDIQDVGARCYTYLSTLLYAMDAAYEAEGITFLVCDRPNPLGCLTVEGQVLKEEFRSFVGVHSIPMRYGLTIGELTSVLKIARAYGVNFTVRSIPMRGYTREMKYEDTGLPWVPPSPNIPTLDTVAVYPGLCLFEGTNVSEGRGTTKPFEYIGAPWCNGEQWARELNALAIPGVLFRPVVFTPAPATKSTKYANQLCKGVAIHVTDKHGFRPIETAIFMLANLIRAYPDTFAFQQEHFDCLAGNSSLRLALSAQEPIEKIQREWRAGVQAWHDDRRMYQLYESPHQDRFQEMSVHI